MDKQNINILHAYNYFFYFFFGHYITYNVPFTGNLSVKGTLCNLPPCPPVVTSENSEESILIVQGFLTSLKRWKDSLLITTWTGQNHLEGMKMESNGTRFSPTDISYRNFPNFANVKQPLSVLTQSIETFVGLQ